MIKKSLLASIAIIVLACGSVHAQSFTRIAPSDLGLASNSGPLNSTFNIGNVFGLSPADVTFTVSNAFVADGVDSWTVADGGPSGFTLGGPVQVEAFINHGANLGSQSFQNGSQSRDGFTASAGETWTYNAGLDTNNYQLGQSANDYFVDYIGPDDGQVKSNSNGFVWVSDQAVSTFTVFSNNTTDLNNNYSVGFRVVQAIPEPSTALLIAFGGMFALRRRRK